MYLRNKNIYSSLCEPRPDSRQEKDIQQNVNIEFSFGIQELEILSDLTFRSSRPLQLLAVLFMPQQITGIVTQSISLIF